MRSEHLPFPGEPRWEEEVEEVLGLPQSADARQRASELMASGWQIVSVLFARGVWRFARPLQDS